MSLRTVSALRRTLWRRAVTLLLNVTRAVSATFTTLTSSAYSRTTAQTATQTLTVKDAEDAAMAGEPWTGAAYRATVDSGESQISTDITNPAANGTDVVTVYIAAKSNLRDANGEAIGLAGIPANQCVITVTPSTGVTITQPTLASDDSGGFVGSFVSTNGATVSVGGVIGGVTITGNATVVVGGGAPPAPEPGEPFFEETFAGNQLNNANGFTWGSPKNTEVVTWDGAPALRCRYNPAAPKNAEQRFALGRSCSHLCVEYEVWVGTEYSHPNTAPSNNKFLIFWRDDYNASASTWMIGYEFQTTADRTPDSNVRVYSNRWDVAAITSSTTGGYVVTGQNGQFVGSSGDMLVRGTWKQVRVELKAASSDSATDGIQKMWIDGVLVSSITNGKFWNPDSAEPDTVLKNGYFMGSANSGYAVTTDFYLRGFKFYDSNPGWT